MQADLFPEITVIPSTSRIGVRLIGQPCQCCGSNIGRLGSSAGPHAARIECCRCGRFQSWLPKHLADAIDAQIDRLGSRPVSAISWFLPTI
jgi:hypothetical protein